MANSAHTMRVGPKAVHPFPARMASEIAWAALERYAGRSAVVLDPMAGSGTTLVTARAMGHRAIGFDTDPLAVLMAACWCSDIDPERTLNIADGALEAAKHIWRRVSPDEAYPSHADKDTRDFIDYWFDKGARRQLSALARSISRRHGQAMRNVLWCALSRMIVAKQAGVSLAMDVSHSRPHRVYETAPVQPFDAFMGAVGRIVAAAPFGVDGRHIPGVRIEAADARSLPLRDDSVDVVITSPPYANAIDYIRGHRLSLVWMRHTVGSLAELRGTNIGSERSAYPEEHRTLVTDVMEAMGCASQLPSAQHGMVARYICDMDKVLSEMRRVLVGGGSAVLVVGDSTLRGVYVQNSEAVSWLAKRHGLQVTDRAERAIPDTKRYLPPPSSSDAGGRLQKRMRREVVISLRKPG